ncbi:hypothetical protein [Streptomyces sp. NPDC050738]|uniref:hypothetical protein n=1 Tax=Streptomyces sp. NPDC050738 TaxID=3154744 RepID=UPI0034399A0B
MRRQQLHAVLAASAATLCLGGLLAACGGGSASGYVAVGAVGSGPGDEPTGAVPPTGKVVLVPLDGKNASGTPGGAGKTPGSGPGSGSGSDSGAGPGAGTDTGGSTGKPSAGSSTGATSGAGPGSGSASGSASGSTGGSGPSAPGTSAPSQPAGPAILSVSAPELADASQRWCEKVTVRFSNTGGSPVSSGTATFATHIIGALGVDWATIESDQPLPGPIAAGAAKAKTYTVCVDSWRVPLGMHIDTRAVTVSWK